MTNRKIDERTKNQLIELLPEYLDRTGRSSKKEFRCINPAHPDVHPSMRYDKNLKKVHCFSCGKNYDVFDVIGIDTGAATFQEQYDAACDYFNLIGESYEPKKPNKVEQPAPDPIDFTEFYDRAHKDIDKTDYHRGLNKETLDRFNIGFVEHWRHPKAPSYVPETPRLIIPISKYSYLARDTRREIPEEGQAFKKGKVKGQDVVTWIFNRTALTSQDKPVFVCEGEIDCMSIVQCGFPAVGLGSTSNVRMFLEEVKTYKPAQPLIIVLDNEDNENTRKAAEDLVSGLKALGISSYSVNIYGKYKDANEFLMADPGALKRALNDAAGMVSQDATAKKETEKDIYIRQNCAASYIQDFLDGISASANTPAISTGIAEVDEALDGGLYPGLHFLGAISSLGKTSLVLQIADYIAQSGHDVLFFSLEMARSELMAKSISRHTFTIAFNETGRTENAKTSRGITDGSRWQHYSQAETRLIKRAVEAYEEYARRIFITEAVGRIGTQQIREAIAKHLFLTGEKPTVFVDYLQILTAPGEDLKRATDKQITDANVTELKQISRDFNIPIFVISSLNRASYKEAISMEAFKESGSIEYSSDVLIGLQLQGAGRPNFDVNAAKTSNPRKIELVVLKNRNGPTGNKADLEYYPLFNYFQGEE